MADEAAVTTTGPAAGGVPAVRGPYHLGGPAATGLGLPFMGLAHNQIGQKGGIVTWAQLQAAGIQDGELYAAGGMFEEPVRLAGVPCLLLACRRVAYGVEAGTYRRLASRVIESHKDAKLEERQSVEALLLALADEPLAGIFSEKLRPDIKHASTLIGPWLKRLGKAPEIGGLPTWARVAGRLRSEGRVSKKSNMLYRRESVDLAPLSAPELAALVAWLKGPGVTLPRTVDAWLTQAAPSAEDAEDAGDLGDRIPF